MPCDSSHCAANGREIELSRVLQLIDEVDGRRQRPNHDAWRGYDKRAYGVGQLDQKLDIATADLCGKLTTMPQWQLRRQSLELQMWWRDHQEADAKKGAHHE